MSIQEPFPFTAVLPKVGNSYLLRDLQNIRDLFHKTEYEMVKRGHRDADVYHLTPQNYDEEIDRIFRDGLIFRRILRSKAYSGFSHRHFPSETLGPDVMVYGVVAKDLDIANEFKAAHENKTDHVKIGQMLGYPDCCSRSFAKYFSKSFDPVYEPAKMMEHKVVDGKLMPINADPMLYAHLRYFGPRVIPWFPCRYDCEESTEKAQIWLRVMRDLDAPVITRLIELLSRPSSWDLFNAQVVVKHPRFIGYSSSYYSPKRRIVKFGGEV